MIYFYAGLGAAMLTGIMVLFEVGLALTGQSLLEERSELDAYQDVVNVSDRLFLRMLTQPQDVQAIGSGRYGSDLCQQILCRIQGVNCRSGNTKNPLFAVLESYETPKLSPPSGTWSTSCALERQLDGSSLIHRVLMRANRDRFDYGYELYSCVVEGDRPDPRCLFESGA